MKSQRLWWIVFSFWYWLWPTAELEDGTLPLPQDKEKSDTERPSSV